MAGRCERAKSTPSSGHQARMIDPKYPQLTPLLEMVHRRKVERMKVEAEMMSRKKRGVESKKPTQDGWAPSAEDENELRTLLESASQKLGSSGGSDVKRNLLALFEASIRVASHKQSSMTDIPHFYLPEKATFADLMKLKLEKLKCYGSVKSFDIQGLSPVTPPTELDTYQIIDTTRPSDTDPEKEVSVAQILSRETDNYFCGVRPTPADPTVAGGFFVFSNIVLPWFFGECYRMSCSSRYKTIESIEICIDSIKSLVEEILSLTVHNCKHISTYTITLFEIGMFLFGEFPRMQGPVDLLQTNFDLGLIISLTNEVLFDMRNWSYLSKTGFAFYLAMVEVALGVIGHKETFLKGWKLMTAAVTKSNSKGCKLDLLGAHGFFSLRKLVGNRLHLLKFDEDYVKRLIIRKLRKHTGRMEALNEANQVQSVDHEGNSESSKDHEVENQSEEVEPEISDEQARKEAKKEFDFWLSLMVDDRDTIIKVLCEVDVDLPDKDQSVDFECAPPKSCPSKPASPGQGKNLLDGFAQDSTLPSELPHVPNYVNSSEQPDDSTSTRECVTPCSSRESLDSDKRSLNTKFKESMLNATAESFTPLASQRPPHPTVSDGAYYYPNSMLSTTGSGLPVGMGFPESYGSMHVVYNSYNANPESLPQGYTQLSWPQFAQSYGGAPIVYSAEPGSSFPRVYTHPSRAQPLQLYGGAPMAGSLPHGYTHLSRPQSLQLYGGAPMAGPLPQGYTHLSLPQPYGGVPTANSAQPGSFPQGYAHPFWPQQYGR